MDEQNPQKRIENMTRTVLRPLASPLPLAFFAFGSGPRSCSAACNWA